MNNRNDRLLSFLGIARKAGRLTLGFDSVCDSAAKHESCMILTAADTSEGTLRKLRNSIPEGFADIHTLPCGIDDIGPALGKSARLISVNDKGFAQKIRELLAAECGTQSGTGEDK